MMVAFCLPLQATDEQRITVNSTSADDGLISVTATGPNGKAIDLMCFDRASSCSVPPAGEYLMELAGKEGVYEDCTNVVLYSSSSGRIGVYCWENSGDCYIVTCSAEKIEVVPSTIPETMIEDHPTSGGAARGSLGKSIPEVFVSVLAEIKAKASVPVLLPTKLPSPFGNAKHATEKATPDMYAVSLWYELDTGDAGFAAFFAGQDHSTYSPRELTNVDKVKLTHGIIGFFRPVSCGGSCAPANIWWERAGTLYQIQLRLSSAVDEKKQQRIITEVANSAIAAGPR
jgi:hypothetical protein